MTSEPQRPSSTPRSPSPSPSPSRPSSTDFDLAVHLADITELVRTSGDLALDWYRDLDAVRGGVENKRNGDEAGDFDPVTVADRAVERRLRDGLRDRFPDHAVLGEEFGLLEPAPDHRARFRWIIDPIDGTRAFITGQPMWGTLVGLQDGGRPIAGWMHVPPLGETYVGQGGGCDFIAPAGTRSIRVSDVVDLADAVLLTTHPSMFAPGEQTERFDALAGRTKLLRYSGDCLNYGLLAMGLADLVVENGLAPYDILPLIPIIEGAGGIVTDLDGRPPLDGGYVVAAASPELHAVALNLLT